MKKTIPFDIDSAAVSYYVQPSAVGKKKVEVLAVTVALEVIARYEALFRAAGFQPGVVTTSALAALNLYHGDGVAVLAKLAGRALTVAVISGGAIKLFRCVALEESTDEEILGVLHPTFAYVEDELGTPVSKLILCGFPEPPPGLRCEVDQLRSRFGAPGAFNAGLLGYMESAKLMRIPINLASEPFRRDRPMLVASGVCAVLLAGLLMVLVTLVISERQRARDTRVAVASLNAKLRTVSAEETKLDAFLRQPRNAVVLERSVLLNQLIDRKSISWTRIFSDLER